MNNSPTPFNTSSDQSLKQSVHDFWDDSSCGEHLYLESTDAQSYELQRQQRYILEPMILDFANFASSKNLLTLEIGVGLGADHQSFAESGAILTGIDLTQRSVDHTLRRLNLFGLSSSVSVADAENLPFPNGSFDLVYSWGVLHHSPDTPKAIDEVHRVLRPGGIARIMIYNKWSIVGFMLWVRYALFTLKPWRSLKYIYSNYLESPGTKAYSRSEAYILFSSFSSITFSTPLTHADLLDSAVGQRHRGTILSLASRLFPTFLIRTFLPNHGLFLLCSAVK